MSTTRHTSLKETTIYGGILKGQARNIENLNKSQKITVELHRNTERESKEDKQDESDKIMDENNDVQLRRRKHWYKLGERPRKRSREDNKSLILRTDHRYNITEILHNIERVQEVFKNIDEIKSGQRDGNKTRKFGIDTQIGSTETKNVTIIKKVLNDSFIVNDERYKAAVELKVFYDKNKVFNIGYILGTIDSVEEEFKRIQKDVTDNWNKWTDGKWEEVFQQMKLAEMLGTILLLCIISPLYAYTKHKNNDIYTFVDNDYKIIDIPTRVKKDVHKDGINLSTSQEFNRFIETIKTDENMLRTGKPTTRHLNKLITKRSDIFDENLNNNEQSRRFLSWFKSLFPEAPTTIKTTTTQTTAATLKEIERDEVNLKTVLNKLLRVLDEFNDNIEKSRNENKTTAYFVMELPVPVKSDDEQRPTTQHETSDENDRVKRDLSMTESISNDKHIVSQNKTIQTSNIDNNLSESASANDKDNLNVTRKRRNKRDVNDDINVEKFNQDPVTSNDTDLVNTTSSMNDVNANLTNTLTLTSGRRNFNPPNLIRAKLLEYLNDIFGDIKGKLVPMVAIKDRFNNDMVFKVGYITANLDTLSSNLIRLKSDMQEHAFSWNEYKILDTFDVLRTYHNVVIKLIDTLKFYLKDRM